VDARALQSLGVLQGQLDALLALIFAPSEAGGAALHAVSPSGFKVLQKWQFVVEHEEASSELRHDEW
jgi:hypothetical protein